MLVGLLEWEIRPAAGISGFLALSRNTALVGLVAGSHFRRCATLGRVASPEVGGGIPDQ